MTTTMEQSTVSQVARVQQRERDPVFLMAAARYGHLNKIRDLCEKQHMAVDSLGDDGFTALHLAVAHSRAAVVEYLVKAGADVFAKNSEGETPYDMAKVLEEKNSGSDIFAAIHAGGVLALGECKICMESSVSLYTLPCGDQACVECIRNWFRSLLDDNEPLKCPSAECQEMDQEEVEPPTPLDAWKLFTRAEYTRFDKQMLQRCLVVTKDFQFCTRCESGGYIEHDCSEVICEECDESWCRECRLPAHKALSCEEFEKIFAQDHEMNLKCINDNCKKCPECKAQIERDGGCSHMKCGQCKYEFCWWCMGKYNPGSYTFDETGDCPCPKLSQSGGWA